MFDHIKPSLFLTCLCAPLLLACPRLVDFDDPGDGGYCEVCDGTDEGTSEDTDTDTGAETEGGSSGGDGHGDGDCLSLGDECDGGGCCGDLFCPQSFGYVPSACEPPRANGDYCLAESECLSGICVDNVCGAPDCIALGESCEFGSVCCDGYCADFAYAPGLCVAPAPSGEYCNTPDQCESGICTDFICE